MNEERYNVYRYDNGQVVVQGCASEQAAESLAAEMYGCGWRNFVGVSGVNAGRTHAKAMQDALAAFDAEFLVK